MARLESATKGGSQRTADVLWVREIIAFTLPGRYVYVSRRLLERCASDDPVAFALAHEIAHHELGHSHGIDEAATAVPRGVPGIRAGRVALVVAALLIERRVHGPEKEADADARALEMCIAAGYDGERCIHLFDILEADARIWAWERLRGYLPIRERKARLRKLLSHTRNRLTSGPTNGGQITTACQGAEHNISGVYA
jgi:predicted Zn-dependent protease